MGDHGKGAERHTEAQVRAALPDGARCHANVRWLAPTRPGGPARNGEIDLLLVLPELGLLVIETKSGPVTLDGHGRWYAGSRLLDPPPFRQAETSARAMVEKIMADPRWHGPLRSHHAVAFPETDRDSLARGRPGLAPDAPLDLVLDRADLATPATTRAALARVIGYWSGDGARDRTLTDAQLAVIGDVVEPEVVLRSLLRSDLDAGERELRAPTQMQLGVLRVLRGQPRAAIVGGAGTGKSLLAIKKARSLAADGFSTVLACFNQPLARTFGRTPELGPAIRDGRLVVGTFHELCRRLAAEAGTLPPQPANPGRAWFDTALPAALEQALPVVGGRHQALVIDEGQDFDELWLLLLEQLLADPRHGVLYVFHDPAQAIYREDAVGTLGLEAYPLPDNCRNSRQIHDFAYRFYDGALDVEPIREDGRAVEVVVAADATAGLDALRRVLHDLVHAEHVDRRQIAVLAGGSLEHSPAWRQRRFKGDLVLWNGNVDDDGRSLGRSADQVPEQPDGTILFDTIHRFKGLDRDVVVLCELRPDDSRLERLLYVGASRARHHLVVIAPSALAERLQAERRLAERRSGGDSQPVTAPVQDGPR